MTELAPTPLGRAFAVYSGLRLLIVAVICVTLMVMGLPALLALAVAVLLSSVLSPFLLRRHTTSLSEAMSTRRQQRQAVRSHLRQSLKEDTE